MDVEQGMGSCMHPMQGKSPMNSCAGIALRWKR